MRLRPLLRPVLRPLLRLPTEDSRGFWPPLLFANGEQGFLYINDISTMYQDSAGTIPAVLEQPVGKWLDQSGRGNHATQPTSANRPTVTARYNFATNTGFSLGATGAVPTDYVERGLVTGRKTVDASTASGFCMRVTSGGGGIGVTDDVRLTTIAGLLVGVSYRVTFKAKLAPGQTSAVVRVAFGSAGSQDFAGTANYQAFSFTTNATATSHSLFFGGSNGALYDVSEVDVRPVIHAIPGIPAYQRVNTATDYDSSGFPVRLKFNGTNQWMQTGSIDFSGTDKMTVFAGVTKLSDAAQGVIGELGNGVSASTTKFTLSASPAAGASYRTDLFETGASLSNTRVATTYAAPTGNVLTVGYDYAQETIALQNQIRVNGQIPSSLTATGSVLASSNFGALSMNMGARNGTSLFFSGDIYCLSARGAPTTDSLIAQAERYINARMGGVF